MSFTRTNSGVSNMYLFYKADIIIFTEGGKKSFSVAEVEDNKFSKSSVDIKFWKGILQANEFKRNIEFRAIGSKTASKSICEKIASGDVKNVAVARDRDLDEYMGGTIDSPFILYTKGYSWENDVFGKEITLSQVESMLLEAELPEDAVKIIEEAYDEFGIYGKSLAKLEVIFRHHGIKFISDLSGECFFNNKTSTSINKNHVLRILKEKKTLIQRPVNTGLNLKNICPYANNYGKLLQALAITVLCHVLKKYSDYKAIPKQIIEVAMIERFIKSVTEKKDTYYFGIVQRLEAG